MEASLRKYTEKNYEVLVEEYFLVKKKLSETQKIKALEDIYLFAWNFPFGRFADARLEKELQEIFITSTLSEIGVNSGEPSDRILHIVSSVYGYGGHSRVLLSWIENDTKHKHDVLITDQVSAIPEWINEVFKKNYSGISILEKKENLEKIKDLLLFVKNGYKAIILYNDPNDLVPVIVGFHKGLPPVIIYNHADHSIWGGVSIADIVVDFRQIGEEYTYEFRGARKSVQIPYLLDNRENSIAKHEAKKKLKSEKYKYCGLAIVSPYKLRPMYGHSFYDFLYGFLSTHTEILFYLIGPSENDWHKYSKKEIPENLLIMGIIEQPEEYMQAADFCFETFPLSGGVGSVDICMHGAIPIFYKDATEMAGLKTILDYSGYLPENEQLVYYNFNDVHSSDNFFGNELKMEMHSKAVKAFITDNYGINKWNEKLAELYQKVDETKHTINLIKENQVDNSPNAIYFNNVFVRSKRDLLYFVLKTNRFSWLNLGTIINLTIQRLLAIILS